MNKLNLKLKLGNPEKDTVSKKLLDDLVEKMGSEKGEVEYWFEEVEISSDGKRKLEGDWSVEIEEEVVLYDGEMSADEAGMNFDHLPWWKKNRFGWPIETVENRPVLNFFRIICQNLRKV